MRNIFVLVCILAMPCLVSAKSDKASWDNLGVLKAGEKIRIVETNQGTHTGRFVGFSDAEIRYTDNSGQQAITKGVVRSVTSLRRRHRLRDALIGAGVGAGIGAAIGVGVNHNSGDPNFIPEAAPLILGACGLVAGLAIGAIAGSNETVYRVK
jgi:hypothetical protein